MTMLVERTLDSPLGVLRLIGSDAGLRAVLWPNDREGRVTFEEEPQVGEHPILERAAQQIEEYIADERTDFDIPLDPIGTDFQRSVWVGLQDIPFGKTRSYGDLAADLARPGAARAVGAAAGRNPISIIIPCHRLVGSSGSLTGFAGGIDSKRWLLDHEASQLF